MVPIQLKNFTPVGTPIKQDLPGGEHVVRPNSNRERCDCDRCRDETLISEDRFTTEDRQDLRGDSEEWQRQDVDLWMTEEPEDVLPEECATVGRVKDVRTEEPVRFERKKRRSEWREGEQDQD
jgi:hypothetical protein